ncbi:hypothetical protein HYFRA_00009717 [Hymenoscyphus fraxineus]|uniref:Uncharacterized protein n=1 Tax=Hymenoscyphus fraxineus TaxID=746836 RepID=A0A9N9PMQ4_9HELO|nr:hypothetical protein HYFRA_00009717 [Hymenoscyphus fraxineus]
MTTQTSEISHNCRFFQATPQAEVRVLMLLERGEATDQPTPSPQGLMPANHEAEMGSAPGRATATQSSRAKQMKENPMECRILPTS